MILEDKDCEFPDDDVDRMTKMLSGANLPPIESLMDGDLQEWRGAPATTLRRHRFISALVLQNTKHEIQNKSHRFINAPVLQNTKYETQNKCKQTTNIIPQP